MRSLLGDRTAASPGTAAVACRPAQPIRSEPARAKGCQPSVSGCGCALTSSLHVLWNRNVRRGSGAVKFRAHVSSNDLSDNGHQATFNGMEEAEGDDFYSVLGVSPDADNAQLKKAYYAIMRDYHPDVSMDDESTEFCIFLNEIYETLTDPDKREIYDEIAGFSSRAVNPFKDTSYVKDKVFVDEFTCIGCKNCCNVCPKTFGIEDEYGRSRVMEQGAEPTAEIQEAIDTCPVDCIHWVSAPELTLLEATMARIERVAVWIMMNGSSSGGFDVFQEAYRAFEKRQAKMRMRKNSSEDHGWVENVVFDREEQMSPQDVQRRAAAGQTATSARRWRDYKRNQRQKGMLCLPSTNGTTQGNSNGSVSTVESAPVAGQ